MSAPAEAVSVRDDPEQHRYEACLDGAHAGSAHYRASPGLITFTHTEVEDAFAGAGVGSALVRSALDDARARGLAVVPLCPFVNGFIARHPEYRALVPPPLHRRFGF